MLILVGNWKKKLIKIVAVIVLLGAFVVAMPRLTGVLHQQVPVLSSWFQDEKPTGNPLQVQNEEKSTRFQYLMDQFIFKLQHLYFGE